MNNNHHSPSANENNIAITAKALPARDPRFPAAFKKLFKRIFILFDGALRKPSTACVLEKEKGRERKENQRVHEEKKEKKVHVRFAWINVGSNVFVWESKKKKNYSETLTPYAPPRAMPPVVCPRERERERKKEKQRRKESMNKLNKLHHICKS